MPIPKNLQWWYYGDPPLASVLSDCVDLARHPNLGQQPHQSSIARAVNDVFTLRCQRTILLT